MLKFIIILILFQGINGLIAKTCPQCSNTNTTHSLAISMIEYIGCNGKIDALSEAIASATINGTGQDYVTAISIGYIIKNQDDITKLLTKALSIAYSQGLSQVFGQASATALLLALNSSSDLNPVKLITVMADVLNTQANCVLARETANSYINNLGANLSNIAFNIIKNEPNLKNCNIGAPTNGNDENWNIDTCLSHTHDFTVLAISLNIINDCNKTDKNYSATSIAEASVVNLYNKSHCVIGSALAFSCLNKLNTSIIPFYLSQGRILDLFSAVIDNIDKCGNDIPLYFTNILKSTDTASKYIGCQKPQLFIQNVCQIYNMTTIFPLVNTVCKYSC